MKSTQSKFRHSALKALFSDSNMLLFLIIGVLCVDLATNSVYDLISSGIRHGKLVALSIGMAVPVIAWFYLYRKIRYSFYQVGDINTDQQPDKHKGLIVLVSREIPCITAINHHLQELKHCWIIYTDQSEKEAKSAEEYAKSKGVKVYMVKISSVYDVCETMKTVDDIYNNLPEGLTEHDVIADFTGLTKFSSIGMVFACLSPNRKLQYVKESSENVVDGVAGSYPPTEVNITWESVGIRSRPD